MGCDDDQLDEAQKSFRNCIESAKAGIVTRHASQQTDEEEVDLDVRRKRRDVDPALCHELDSILSGCEEEVAALSRCKGRRHVDNLKAIHLSSIADVLKALNEDLKVEECQVFHQNIEHEVEEEQFEETEVHRFPENGPESISGATYWMKTSTLAVFISVGITILL